MICESKKRGLWSVPGVTRVSLSIVNQTQGFFLHVKKMVRRKARRVSGKPVYVTPNPCISNKPQASRRLFSSPLFVDKLFQQSRSLERFLTRQERSLAEAAARPNRGTFL